VGERPPAARVELIVPVRTLVALAALRRGCRAGDRLARDRALDSSHLAHDLPEAASAFLGVAGGVFGGLLSLVTLTSLALFMLMERPTITNGSSASST
jgi:hypothetical protein